MRAGSFSFELVDSVPESVLAQLRGALGWSGSTTWSPSDGHIVVTSVPVEETSLTLAQSLYTGRLTKQDGIRSFSGAGLASWLGADGVPSAMATSYINSGGTGVTTISGAQTLSLGNWISALVTYSNGITAGTIKVDASTLTATWEWTSPIEMLDAVCAHYGVEWRINPVGTIDVNNAATLFRTGSVFISELGGESEMSPRGLTGAALSPSIDSSERTSLAVVVGTQDQTTAVASAVVGRGTLAGGTVAYGVGGAAATLVRVVDAPQSVAAEALSQSATVVGSFDDPRFNFDVAVSSERTREYVAPGDTVYVWQPRAGIYATGTAMEFRGESVFPVSVRVQRITWPVVEGYGVYLYRRVASTITVTDLTPYVAWPAAGANLEVGSAQGLGDASTLTGQARF